MKKTTSRGQKRTVKVLTSIVPEDLADVVRRLNNTLWDHLPQHKQRPYLPPEERTLAILGAKNCLRRINLDYPDDVLTDYDLADVVKDLLEALEQGNANKSTILSLLWDYQERGFIIPRYRVLYCARMLHCPRGRKNSCREECQDRDSLSLRIDRNYVYDGELLKEIRFGSEEKHAPPIPGPMSPVRYYREKRRLSENTRFIQPGSKEFRFSTPLFTFSQTWQVLKLYRALHFVRVNLLTPLREYKKMRESWFPVLKEILEEIGCPKFCKNPTCMRPLSPSDTESEKLLESLKQGKFPVNNQQAGQWSREYCNRKCRQSAHNSHKPISTLRVKKYYTKELTPFLSFSDTSLPFSRG